MTMTVSKMVVDKQKSSEAVQAAVTTHEGVIVEGAQRVLGEDAGSAMALVLNRAKSQLKEATDNMIRADDAHIRELGDDKGRLTARDDQKTSLYTTLIDFKEIGTATFGAVYMERLGLSGKTPHDPVALERLATLVQENAQTETPPPARKGITFDMKEWLDTIAQEKAALSDTLRTVALERREAEATQVAKNEAIAEYDKVFSLTATLVSALLENAGKGELADRVRPSKRRVGQTASSDTEETNMTEETAI